jgi:hypothetical protein
VKIEKYFLSTKGTKNTKDVKKLKKLFKHGEQDGQGENRIMSLPFRRVAAFN